MVHAHSLVALSWKLDLRLAIVSRSAKFIINTARGAARCQTERESRAYCSPERNAEGTDRDKDKPGAGEGKRERKHLDYLAIDKKTATATLNRPATKLTGVLESEPAVLGEY